MELGGQNKEIGVPSSIGYNNNSPQLNQESSSKLSSVSVPTADRRNESGIILSPTQTLDQYHQFNVQQQTQRPDPAPAHQLASAAATIAGASNSNTQPPPETNNNAVLIRYRECLKNHAASMGGHVVDGCGEFMPSGEEGTMEALKCAACECHRNFHRRVIEGELPLQLMENCYLHRNTSSRRTTIHHTPPQPPPHQQHQFSHHYSHSLASPTAGPMMMTFGRAGRALAESSSEDLNIFQSNAAGTQTMAGSQSCSASKKRFRSKFTKEQKDRMHEFAEKVGWKIQKQDDEEVQQFCNELGVKRQVFKVWMHNNKQAIKKKQHE